jgi:D-arabinose 1-dehydrogenase-like Zn-dependent alcohol dehydrogenase
MRAARFYKPNEPLRIEEVPMPALGPNEVIVEVKAAGLCGSDVHIVEGDTFTGFTPITLGHECAGVIAEVGEQVSGWEPGDRVCIDCVTTCGLCYNCLRGRDSICLSRKLIGIHLDGAFAQYVKVSARNLVELPESVSFEQGAILTDAVATPYHAITKRARLSVGESIAIFGLGGLGVHALQLAKLMGAGLVIGVDVEEAILSRALAFGADVVIDGIREDPVKRIKTLTGGYGVDVALECIGKNLTVSHCVESVRGGGRAVVLGLGPDSIHIRPITEFVRGEIELIGSSAFELKEIQQIVQLVASDRLNLSKSITRKISLEEVNEGIDDLKTKKGNPIRILITEI